VQDVPATASGSASVQSEQGAPASPGIDAPADAGGRRDAAVAQPAAAVGQSDAAPAQPGPLSLLARVEQEVDALAHGELDELSDAHVDELLTRLRRPVTQLEGLRARAAALSQSRRLAAVDQAASAGTALDHQRELGRQQRMPPSEVKKAIEAGRAAQEHEATDRAVRDGELGPSQARLIARILREVEPEQRVAVEEELLELAGALDPVTFGRRAREVLARIRPAALAADERRQQLDRSFRGRDTEDGGFAFSGLLYGSAAEHARVALRAFRRPDTPGEHRRPEQRGADAFEQLCAAALAAGSAPTNHGVRPQVLVVMDVEQFALLEHDPLAASGRFVGSGQPISGAALRHLVADSELVRMVLDADSTPLDVSSKVRTVPQGLWRALQIRDGGCVWPSCDAPASWCDVAHGAHAYTDDGKLSVDNSMLLCRRHHRRFDNGDRRVVIEGDRVRFPGQPDTLEGATTADDASTTGDATTHASTTGATMTDAATAAVVPRKTTPGGNHADPPNPATSSPTPGGPQGQGAWQHGTIEDGRAPP